VEELPAASAIGAVVCTRVVAMATARQHLGSKGEQAVSSNVPCPRCNRARHLAKLQANFQCADLICKFCGYLAQGKATTLADGPDELPKRILGAAWGPQHEQIVAGIYHGLYIVGYSPSGGLVRIDYVPAHILQTCPEVFEPRNPLGATAKRAGWRGFNYNLEKLPAIGIKQVYPAAR
jgi:Dam-replacing family